MIYDWQNGIPDPTPYGKLYDATGSELEGQIFWADTETGEVKMWELGADGLPIFLDISKGELKVLEVRYPAPLKFVPLGYIIKNEVP